MPPDPRAFGQPEAAQGGPTTEATGGAVADPATITTRQEFAHGLTVLREAAGLGVREVARVVGLPASTVGDYFGGAHLPPVTTAPKVLADILRGLGVDDPATVEHWQQALRRVRRTRRLLPATPPYRGLHSFQPDDAAWFFGRDRLTALLLARLAEAWSAPGGVVVVGPSGSGKSSLLRAGLVPALRRGDLAVPGPAPTHVPVFTPGAAPLDELARTLAGRGRSADDLAAALRAAPAVAPDLVRQATGPDGRERPVTVLVVDQLEEVFTLCTDDAERRAFLDVLRALTGAGATGVPAPTTRIVFGLRADFYAHALRGAYVADVLQRAQVVVGPMTEPELRQAIVEPARKAGVALEDGLVELLLREAAPGGASDGWRAGALPLLSHALLATWELGRQRMGIAEYRSTGGIHGAVAATAERVYADLDERRRGIARRLLLRLVHVSDDTADSRRRVDRSELVAADRTHAAEVLDRFIAHRLVTADAERVEISHEALLVAWPRLRGWLDEDRAGLRTHRRLGAAAAAWRQAGHDPATLYRGTPLAAAREWAADPVHHADLNPDERDFLEASLAAQRAEERADRRRTRRLRQLVGALTVLVLVALALAGYGLHQRDTLASERNLAISRQMAITADGLRGTDPAVAMQLSLAAYRVAPTPEARASLLESFVSPAVARVTGGPGVMQAVAVSHDGRLLAGAGADGTVRLWRLGPDRPRPLGAPLTGHAGTLFALAFSPDGRTLASAGTDGSVRLWDTTGTGRPLGEPLRGPGGTVYALAFSPDGRTLVAGCSDGLIWRWGTADRDHPVPVAPPLSGFGGAVQSVAFRADGRVLAAGGADNTVRQWDTADPAAVRPLGAPLTGPGNTVFSVAYSADGGTLAAGVKDGTVWLWGMADPAAPVPLGAPLTGPTSWVNAVAFGADGLLAAGSSDGKVWLWDWPGRRPLSPLGHPGPVTAMAFLADGRTLATGASDGIARLWHLPGPLLHGPAGPVFSLGYTRRGHTLAVASADNTLGLWNTGDPHAPRRLGPPATGAAEVKRSSGAAAITVDGRLAATGDIDGTVQLFDVRDPAHPGPAHPPLAAGGKLQEAVAFRPDGRVLAVGGDDNTVRLWDVADPARPVALGGPLTGPTNYVFSVAFSPDGRILAAGGADNQVRLWDVADPGRPRPLGAPLTGPTNYVYSVAFSPDGRTLAVASADNTVRLWSVADPRRPAALGAPLPGPHDYAVAVAISPDGRTLAAGGGDGTIWLWSLADPRHPARLATLTGPTGAVYALAFDPEGGILASSGADKVTRLWDTDPERVAAWICATAGDPVTAAEWARYVPAPAYTPPCAAG
jgi:WD40 repeat protein